MFHFDTPAFFLFCVSTQVLMLQEATLKAANAENRELERQSFAAGPGQTTPSHCATPVSSTASPAGPSASAPVCRLFGTPQSASKQVRHEIFQYCNYCHSTFEMPVILVLLSTIS